MNFNTLKAKHLSKSKLFIFLNENKYAPLIFFSLGFVWDWITLDRVDKLSDVIILTTYLFVLSLCLFIYNTGAYLKIKNLYIKYKTYLPLAIQFLLGGLTSAYVIYFSKSVSFSKTIIFFFILIVLLFANEIFKKRVSNIYFQFGFYAFVSFIFFAYMLPVFVSSMNSFIFTLSGIISFSVTYFLIRIIFKTNLSINKEVSRNKLLSIVVSVYSFIALCYYFNLIPPVPLALNKSIVAYDIEKINSDYKIAYETESWYVFWREHKHDININDKDEIYVFTSIFAPTDLDIKVYHLWKIFNPKIEDWETTDKIGYEINGGRDGGYRGYTFKQNIIEGEWKVEVITEEGLIIGVVSFKLINKQIEHQDKTRTIKI